MNDFFGLLVYLLGPVRVTVPQVGHCDPAREVKKLSAFGIPKFGSFPPYDFKNRAGIIADEEFLVIGRVHGFQL